MENRHSDPTAERRDEVVRRMLATPPVKHKPKKEEREPKPAPTKK